MILYFCDQKKSDSALLCQSLSVCGWKEFVLTFILQRAEIPKSWHDFCNVFSVFSLCWYYRFHTLELLFSLFFVFHTESKQVLDWSVTHSPINENPFQFRGPYILYYAFGVSHNKLVLYGFQSVYCLICIATTSSSNHSLFLCPIFIFSRQFQNTVSKSTCVLGCPTFTNYVKLFTH